MTNTLLSNDYIREMVQVTEKTLLGLKDLRTEFLQKRLNKYLLDVKHTAVDMRYAKNKEFCKHKLFFYIGMYKAYLWELKTRYYKQACQ